MATDDDMNTQLAYGVLKLGAIGLQYLRESKELSEKDKQEAEEIYKKLVAFNTSIENRIINKLDTIIEGGNGEDTEIGPS